MSSPFFIVVTKLSCFADTSSRKHSCNAVGSDLKLAQQFLPPVVVAVSSGRRSPELSSLTGFLVILLGGIGVRFF